MKVWRQKHVKPFLKRLAVSVIAIGLLYVLAFVLPGLIEENRQRPVSEASMVGASIKENLLAFNALRAENGDEPSMIVRLDSLRAKLDSTITELESAPSSVTVNNAELSGALKSERAALSVYDTRLELLRKPISYNPEFDLGLKLPVNELSGRIQASINALAGIQRDSSLSSDLREEFDQFVACFTNLKAELGKQAKSSQFKSLRKQCIAKYSALRREAVLFAVGALEFDGSNQLASSLKTLGESLFTE